MNETTYEYEREYIRTNDDLVRCSGMLLEEILSAVKDEIEKCKKSGIRFKVQCKVDDHWNYENNECFVDDADADKVFNTDKRLDWETIGWFLLDCWERVYKMSYMKQQPRGLTSIDIYREDCVNKHLKFTFNIPMSYAWYRKRCYGDTEYEHCFDIVQEYFSSTLTDTYHLLSVTCPSKYFTGVVR